ncbi:copper amine oxidase N-terminal domain-containing protein [Anaerophilus nitritogenes]|uniref:copper amine oxidase N-terminal domain-containing protein n=1 Tax=Anaerophilus nitritogenes TaxID=2498136 RepID=UPI00101CC5EA|nr:copper amine oxidase N-terminal domain-containing protein [Anaerophilus nitritogenes]
MKRKLSLLLVLSLMVSLVPMSAFAASDNNVDKVARVKNDANLAELGAPVLNIENDKAHWSSKETFTLRLEDSNWLENGDNKESGKIADFNAELATEIENASKLTVAGTVYGVKATVARRSDSRLEITVENTEDGTVTSNKIAKDLVVKVPMWVEMDGENAKVNIESKSGALTEGTYAFAQGRTGETTIYVEDTVTFSTTKKIENIIIEENAVGTFNPDDIKEGYIKLNLDKDFEWLIDDAKIGGDLIDQANIKTDGNYKVDKNELRIYVKGTNGTTGFALKKGNGVIGEIELSDLYVRPSRNAKEGKVNVTISSNLSEIKTTKLEIGEFADYKMEVKADGDAKEIYSGRYEVSINDGKYSEAAGSLTMDEDHELQTLIIKEKVEGSWVNNRSIVVKFPSWVKIVGVDKDGSDKGAIIRDVVDKNEYEFEMDADKVSGKKEVKLTFYVSAQAGKSGDIEAVIGGRGIDEEYTVLLGKAVAPVKVEAEVAPIKAGVRNQEIGKITITENKAGAILEGNDIVLELDKDMDWDGEPTVKVTKGDLEIDEDDIKVKDNVLTIRVEDESTEASTIEITNGKVKVDRSIAEGRIEVEVQGKALIQNGYDNETREDKDGNKISKSKLVDNYGVFNDDYYAKVEVANVITPADPNTRPGGEVKFVIGQSEYQVGEETKTVDVAPYIQDGRTMLSLRYVAEAVGVADANIIWNEQARTVTIFKGDRIAQVEIGSNRLMVNGTAIHMDTVTTIKDGRTMLPISFIARALGLNAEWDGDSRTVTIK